MMTHEQQLRKKRWHRQKRRNAAKHKADERLRTASYQKKIDMIARDLKRKGKCRAHKIKGETMTSLFPVNSNCAKSWAHLNGKPMRKESMKVAIIWSLT